MGKAGDAAAATIERENPAVNAVIITPETSYITVVLCDRVLVFVDANGIVNQVPFVG